MPFLSIITRNHPKRPNLLKRCIASVEMQKDKDFEHIILYDDRGLGIPHANRMFFENRHLATGKYVFMLDDDDVLITDDFVGDIKQVANEHNDPSIIFIKMLLFGIAYPLEGVWSGNIMLRGQIGTSCFVTLNKVWQENIDHFATTDLPGDFNFIYSLFLKNLPVCWHNKIYSKADCLNYGKPEYENSSSCPLSL